MWDESIVPVESSTSTAGTGRVCSYMLKSIKIENFKSYKGVFEISPFPVDFNANPLVCIVGPNGSGKSNLMDAVAFCFNCADAAKLRGDGGVANLISDSQSSASVTVTLSSKTSTDDFAFTRSVNASGDSKYILNGRKVTLESYRERMVEAGLDTKGTFLVFQGDVEALALSDPASLGKVIDRVSGSAALAKDFIVLQEKKQRLERDCATLAERKKKLTVERKQVKNELAEIAKIDLLVKRKQAVIDNYFLSKLWLVGQEEGEMGVLQTGQAEDVTTELKRKTTELEETKAARAKADMKQSKLARKLITEETELRFANEAVDRIEARQRSSTEKLERLSAVLALKREKLTETKTKMISLENRIAIAQSELETELTALDKLMSGGVVDIDAQRDRDVVLPFLSSSGNAIGEPETKRLLNRFRSIDVPSKTAVLLDDLAELEKQLIHARESLAVLSGRRAELSEQLVKNEALEKVVDGRVAELEQSITIKTKEMKKLRKLLDSSKAAKLKNRQDKLEAEKKVMLDELADIKETEAECVRERQLADTVAELTVRFGSDKVFGRIVDLVKPSEDRLSVAVQTAIGRFMDAVLVRNVSVAREAVAWLKQEKRGQITFIPVEDVNVVVKRIPSDCLSALDAIVLSSALKEVQRGVEFVLGDVAICESIKSARSVAFAKDGITFVTVAGESISTNGNITVGGSNSKTSRFALKHVTDIANKLEIIDKELALVMTDLGEEAVANEKLASEVRAKELEIASDTSRLVQLKSEFKRINDAVAVIAKCIADNRAQAAEAENHVKSFETEKQTKQANIRQIVQQATVEFLNLSFNLQSGDDATLLAIAGSVNDPSASAKAQLDAAKARQKEIVAAMDTNVHALLSEKKCLDFELNDFADVRSVEEEKVALQRSIGNAAKEVGKAQQTRDSRNAAVAELKAELESVRKLKSESEAKIKEIGVVLHGLRDQQLQQRSIIDAKRKRLEQLKQRRLNILKEAVMANACIPLTLSDEDLALGSRDEVSKKIIESVFVSLTAVVPYGGVSSQDSVEALVDEVLDKIDFSSVARSAPSTAQTRDLTRDYQSSLREVEAELSQCGTVSRREGETADSALSRIDADLKRIADSADRVKTDLAEATTAAKTITEQRNGLFLNCFKFVARKVEELYKILTSYESGAHHEHTTAIVSADAVSTAAASLDLEIPIPADLGSAELFTSGVIFSLMPPFKRYTSIELLSGGEKTVAAVALVFSLLAFSAPPFSMVDEIDAALDAGNLSVLARFMRTAVSQQLIAISLKENLYSKADCLIGVYKDPHTSGSGLVTVDLRPYPEEIEGSEDMEAPQTVQKSFSGPLMTPGATTAPASRRREGHVLAGGA